MLKTFTGFYGLVASVQLDPDHRVFVVAADEPTLERAVNSLLAGEGEFNRERCKPGILIHPDLFPNQ